MSNILTIGYTTEGSTDVRFLSSIILRVFEDVALQCTTSIEVFEPEYIHFDKKEGFANDFAKISKLAHDKGYNVLCVHADADNPTDKPVWESKINPALKAVQAIPALPHPVNCKNIVPIVPVYMTESWMLADKELLKHEIGTTLSNQSLQLTRLPESIADPKSTIQTALMLAQKGQSRRRNLVTLSDLYQPIGQKMAFEKLNKLQSFRKFRDAAHKALVKLNYLT